MFEAPNLIAAGSGLLSFSPLSQRPASRQLPCGFLRLVYVLRCRGVCQGKYVKGCIGVIDRDTVTGMPDTKQLAVIAVAAIAAMLTAVAANSSLVLATIITPRHPGAWMRRQLLSLRGIQPYDGRHRA